jgi:hypothetical protein
MNLGELFRPLESLSNLDPVGDAIQKKLSAILDTTPLGGLLRGDWLGHPIHPALVTVSAGSLFGASVLDFTGEPAAARRLMGFGLATAPPVLWTGWADWSTLDQAQRRVGLVHVASNATGLSFLLASYLRRRQTTDGAARLLSVLGLAAIGAGGAIGGHLVFSQGARVGDLDGSPAGAAYDPAQVPTELERASGRHSAV